jgi:HK97 family phage portal protein
MGLISWTASKAAAGAYRVYAEIADEIAKERRLRLTDGRGWNIFGRTGSAGKTVTLESAMKLPAFAACVRVTAQAIASMPLQLFQRTETGGRIPARDHPLTEILSVSPNIDQTALEYWEGVVAWMMAQGNACSEISRGFKDRVNALSLLPGCMPDRDRATGDLVYRYVDRGKLETLPREKVFHVKGFGFGGDSGMSVIRYGVESFSTALAAMEVSGKLFSNGLQTSGILTSEQALKKEQRDQLQKIMETYVGSEKAGKLMILEAGLSFERVTLSPVDAQLLEQQRFSIEDVCRWCGTPPIIIGHSPQGQTMFGSGVEQTLLAWLQLGLNPIGSRIEKRIRKQLISFSEQSRIYAEFNRESFLQMDAAAKASFLSSMTQNALMTRNEGRDKLNLPRMEGADELTAQTSLAPLGMLGSGGQAGQQARAAMLAWLGIPEGEKHEQTKSSQSAV